MLIPSRHDDLKTLCQCLKFISENQTRPWNQVTEHMTVKPKKKSIPLATNSQTVSCCIYKSYYFNLFHLSSRSHNNYCYLKPLTPFKIEGFTMNSSGEHWIGRCEFHSVQNFSCEPTASKIALEICSVDTIRKETGAPVWICGVIEAP